MNKTLTAPDKSGELLRAGQTLTVTGSALVEWIASGGIKRGPIRVNGSRQIGPFGTDVQLAISATNGVVSYGDEVDADDLSDSGNRYGSVGETWRKIPSIFRLRLAGTGTIIMDSKDSLGNVTTSVASYTVTNASDQIEYPYPGNNAVEIRVTLTGTATAEVI